MVRTSSGAQLELRIRRYGGLRLEILVVLGVAVLFGVLIVPAIQQSREAARRTQSKNNLKQWMLAINNYEELFKVLPLGGSIDPQGIGHHGWPTRLVPFLAQSILFNEFEFDQPWDSPRNDYLCLDPIWINLNPGIDSPTTTAEGYSVLHYDANPNLLHRNHCTTSSEMSNGQENTWVLGEASGDFLPWAYPYNWRALGNGLNQKSSGFGRLDQIITQFGMADGSVRTLSKDIDPVVLKQLSDAPPVATPEQVRVPPRPTSFPYSGTVREFSIRENGDYWPTVFVNRRNRTREVQIGVAGKGGNPDPSRPSPSFLRELTENQDPATTSLAGPLILDETVMDIVGNLQSLRTLQVDRIEATPAVIDRLKTMKSLRVLQASRFPDGQREFFQKALPNIEIKPHSIEFGFRSEK